MEKANNSYETCCVEIGNYSTSSYHTKYELFPSKDERLVDFIRQWYGRTNGQIKQTDVPTSNTVYLPIYKSGGIMLLSSRFILQWITDVKKGNHQVI